MLHQSRTLKGTTADKPQDRHETSGIRESHDSSLNDNIVEMSESGKPGSVTATHPGSETHGVTRVFVLAKTKIPLMPAHPARVRQLRRKGKTVVNRRFPFIVRLKTRKDGNLQPVAIKLDPGSSTTGIALVRMVEIKPQVQTILFLAELTHRGERIRDALTQRRSFRRSRRSRKTRYRAPRFNNRMKPDGWLPPSLRHRLETTMSWIHRFQRWTPLTGISQELVRFDLQLLENPEISGVEYQQGTLAGYEVKEYLLERENRTCAYCGKPRQVLNIEHIIPRAKGGSDRIGNLTIACVKCNTEKGSRDVEDFVKDQEKLWKILAGTKHSLAPAAAVNSTRFALLRSLQGTGLPFETGTGGQTKWNRKRFNRGKTHALDAACVGAIQELRGNSGVLEIKAMGRGTHKRTRLTKDGFPRGYLDPKKEHFGFRTGDLVKAEVPAGKFRGTHSGRIAVRKTGKFVIQTTNGNFDVSNKHCRKIQRADGYSYNQTN